MATPVPMPDDPVHRAFDMVADERTRLLILGSLPGQKSLAAGQYYANPGNQFWRLLTPVVRADLVALDYPARLAALLDVGIGLWDVIGSARRFGSLDSALRDADIRDLNAAIARLPALRAMAFNGAAAVHIGVRQLGDTPPVELIALPSSSGAHAVGIAAKQPAWDRLRAFVDRDQAAASSVASRSRDASSTT
jgi:double-stranded uracil-DNA glycosylase